MTGGDAIEGGSGPGSYNIRQSVWHVNVGTLISALDLLLIACSVVAPS